MTIAIAFIALVLAIITLRDWRCGVTLLIAWLLLEATFRRLVPQSALIIFLMKDVLVIALLTSYVVARLRSGASAPLRRQVPMWAIALPALCLLGLSVIHAVNPQLPSYFVGLFGLKAHFMYIPLLALGFYLFTRRDRMVAGLTVFALTSLIVLGVAIEQILFPSQGFVSTQALYSFRLHSTHSLDLLMPTSIFAGELRFASHALLCTFIGLGVLGSVYSMDRVQADRRLILAAWAAFLTALASVFFTGKNLAIVLALVLIPVCLIATIRMRAKGTSVRFPIKRAIAGMAALVVVIVASMPERTKLVTGYLLYRIAEGGLQEEGTLGVARELSRISADHGVMGIGVGQYTQGIGALAGLGGFREDAAFRYHEGSLPKVFIELGIAGATVWMWLVVAVLGLGLAAVLRTKDALLRPIAIGLYAYVVAWFVYAWKSHAFFDDPFQQIPLWLVLGMLLQIGYGNLSLAAPTATDEARGS